MFESCDCHLFLYVKFLKFKYPNYHISLGSPQDYLRGSCGLTECPEDVNVQETDAAIESESCLSNKPVVEDERMVSGELLL